MGHILSGTVLKPNPTTVAAIAKAPVPQMVQQLGIFLGFMAPGMHKPTKNELLPLARCSYAVPIMRQPLPPDGKGIIASRQVAIACHPVAILPSDARQNFSEPS